MNIELVKRKRIEFFDGTHIMKYLTKNHKKLYIYKKQTDLLPDPNVVTNVEFMLVFVLAVGIAFVAITIGVACVSAMIGSPLPSGYASRFMYVMAWFTTIFCGLGLVRATGEK